MFLREKKEKLVFDLQLLLFTYKNTRTGYPTKQAFNLKDKMLYTQDKHFWQPWHPRFVGSP